MNENQRRVLRVLLERSPQSAAEITTGLQKLFGSGYAHPRTLVTLGGGRYLKQERRGSKGSLWHITDLGREEAEAPEPEPYVPPVKTAWEKLNWEAQQLLRLLGKGRLVYKRRGQYPCLEKPIQPTDLGRGLGQLIGEHLVDRLEGSLQREARGFKGRHRWVGEWGRYAINDAGRSVLALDPKKED